MANCLGRYSIEAAGDVQGQMYSVNLYVKAFKYALVFSVSISYWT